MPKDELARGAKSATYAMPNVSREKWDDIWMDYDPSYGSDEVVIARIDTEEQCLKPKQKPTQVTNRKKPRSIVKSLICLTPPIVRPRKWLL